MVDEFEPRESFTDSVESVCLPMASDISRLVSVDLPPKKRRVSQQSVIVCAESSYVAFSWESDCRMIEQEMLRLRTTAMVRSKSGPFRCWRTRPG